SVDAIWDGRNALLGNATLTRAHSEIFGNSDDPLSIRKRPVAKASSNAIFRPLDFGSAQGYAGWPAKPSPKNDGRKAIRIGKVGIDQIKVKGFADTSNKSNCRDKQENPPKALQHLRYIPKSRMINGKRGCSLMPTWQLVNGAKPRYRSDNLNF